MRREPLRITLVFGLLVAVAGCAGYGGAKRKTVEPTVVSIAAGELPESELLDVGIKTFDPGTESEVEDEEGGIFPVIRNAESRFIPVHLKNTMQRTGHWGAVRVIPTRTEAVDVLVEGEILQSDGESLVLAVDAYDSTGRHWFSHVYEAHATIGDYKDHRRGEADPFQDLYDTIANDLATFKQSLDASEVQNVRRVSKLRFAAWLAPDAFRPYLEESEDGIWSVVRLPAQGDPMLERVVKIREREYMFVDTVTGHYDGFYADMWEPYVGWRQARSEELDALREVKRKARNRKLLGAAAIVGAIALEMLGGGNNTSSMRNVMIVGGAAAIKSGFDIGNQAEIHEEAIRELGVSFEAEVEPMVVEVEGETVELTGSAEKQYADWRRLLKSIYFTETGLDAAEGFRLSPPAPRRADPAPAY